MALPDWADSDLQDVAPYLDQWADSYNIDRAVIYGIASQESRFNADATGAAGEIGVMQLMPSTAAGEGYSGDPALLYDPNTNIQWGVDYFAGLLNRFNDTDTALSAYNGGYRNGTITDPDYVNGVAARAAYFTALWAGQDPAAASLAAGGGGGVTVTGWLVLAGLGYAATKLF